MKARDRKQLCVVILIEILTCHPSFSVNDKKQIKVKKNIKASTIKPSKSPLFRVPSILLLTSYEFPGAMSTDCLFCVLSQYQENTGCSEWV